MNQSPTVAGEFRCEPAIAHPDIGQERCNHSVYYPGKRSRRLCRSICRGQGRWIVQWCDKQAFHVCTKHVLEYLREHCKRERSLDLRKNKTR